MITVCKHGREFIAVIQSMSLFLIKFLEVQTINYILLQKRVFEINTRNNFKLFSKFLDTCCQLIWTFAEYLHLLLLQMKSLSCFSVILNPHQQNGKIIKRRCIYCDIKSIPMNSPFNRVYQCNRLFKILSVISYHSSYIYNVCFCWDSYLCMDTVCK